MIMNCRCSVVYQAPPPGKGPKFGGCNTRENTIMKGIQEFDDINDFGTDSYKVINFSDLKECKEVQRNAQIFQEVSGKVSGVKELAVFEIVGAVHNEETDRMRKMRCMTGRFPGQEDLEEKTISPLRQSSDSKTKGCLFVEKVGGGSVCIPAIPFIVQEGFWTTTQDIKYKNLDENERKKPPGTLKDPGDGAS